MRPDAFVPSSPPGPLVEHVRRIAVLRANALGDYLFTVPALEAVRAAYPAAEIVLLGTPLHRDLLSNRPGPVDRVIVCPPAPGVRLPTAREPHDPAAVLRFAEEMRHERFDLALQLHGGGRNSNPFVLRLGARVTAGMATPDAPPLDRTMPFAYYQHEVLRLLEAVALVGAAPVVLAPRLAITEADLAQVRRLLADPAAPFVVLHPGATDARRRWPADRFAAVGDALAEAGATVVITGTPPEQQTVAAVCAAMRARPVVLCGALSVGGLAGLLSCARLVVSNDTGPRHLAEAVGTATVSVYWCANLINSGPLTRSRHRPHISWRLDCPVCGVLCVERASGRDGTYGRGCDHDASFVADVAVDEVLADVLDLFGSRFLPGFGVSARNVGQVR